jgi:branched-subunit amino acid transport protein
MDQPKEDDMIESNYFFLNVFLLATGTLMIRGCFIALSSRMKINPSVRDLFTFIPAAIFPALIMPGTFFHFGTVDWLMGKERFVVLMLAAVFGYFIRHTLAVIVFGLGLLFLLTSLS